MKITTLLVSSIISFSAYSQQASPTNFTAPMMMRSFGVSFQKFDGLNSRIVNRPEYKQLRDYTGTLDLGWMDVHNRLVSDIDFTAGSSMSGDRERKSSTVRYVGAAIDLGYDLLAADKLMLYPIIGIGAQGYQARFYRDNAAVLFNDVLESPMAQNNIRPVSFTNNFLNYRVGIGFALRSSKHPSSTMGIRVGYTGSFKEKDWKSNANQTLADAPEDRLSQFNVSLTMTSLPHLMK